MSIPDGVKPYCVSEINTMIKARLEEHFVLVWVTGEVSNYVKAASGHIYFTLKDQSGQIRCMMPRGFNLRLRFDPRDGLSVFVRATITVYAQRGDLQLMVEELHPKGIGAAELALRQLKDQLRAKGYFDPKRKRTLPRYPKRIALITSATGAAIRDMLELLRQRWPIAQVVVRPCRVQGETAGQEVSEQLRLLSQLHRRKVLPLCAIVIGRGGGSTEDLWAFNEEVVANAIYECAVPVISAVGHETDVTIADLVADHRAETPSAAIMLLVPHHLELLADLQSARSRLLDGIAHRLKLARQQVDQLAQRPAFRKPLVRLRELGQRLDETRLRLDRATKRRQNQARDELALLAEQLEALSPLGVLRRGYSLTRRADGKVIRTLQHVAVGDVLNTKLADGELQSQVISVGERELR